MAESDGDIEYLEEDAEIVQQCVRSTQLVFSSQVRKIPTIEDQPELSLVTERSRPQKRKKKEEDDSEYDPSEEDLPPSPPSPIANFRKKRVVKKTVKTTEHVPYFRNKALITKSQLLTRKKSNIRVPDYDDPLCLPVRAIKADDIDLRRLSNWNKVCLEHFKHCDTLLKPERGVTKCSTRTAIFRNVFNKSGNTETTIWSKTCVENEDADKKSEIFQCVLPRYKEKRVLGNYILGNQRGRTTIKCIDEVILSKENHKDGDALVVYRPRDSLSAVYGLMNKAKSPEDQLSEEPTEPPTRPEDTKMYLKELTACRVCATCFQTSWRGVIKQNKKSVVCPVCARTSVTVYNLLSHFKSHSGAEIRRYKKIISSMLAEIVEYHYRCRVCRRSFDGIKQLRQHVLEHQSRQTFTCEVCNHVFNH